MAKSIYALLDDLMTETSVPAVTDKDGKELRKYYGMVDHTLPREALPTSAQFEDAEELLTWAEDAGVLHACLQSGVQSRIIDYRAIFKGMKKDDVWTPEFGQDNVDTAEWKVVSRPEGKVDSKKAVDQARFNDCMKAISGGLAQGKDKIALEEFLTLMYPPELTKACFEAIEKLQAV